jgi:hypothetical protein
MIEYNPTSGQPGLWLSVLGSNGFWPLEFIAPKCNQPYLFTISKNGWAKAVPRALDFAPTTAIYSLVVGGVCLAVLWRLPSYFHDSAISRRFFRTQRLVARRSVFATLCVSAMLFVSGLYLYVWCVPLETPIPHWRHLIPALILAELSITALLFTLSTAVEIGRLLSGSKSRAARQPWFQLLSCAVAGIGVLGLYAITMPQRSDEAAFRFARTVHFESGLSPLVSASFLGALLFGWGRSQLLVTQQFAQYSMRRPFPSGSPSARHARDLESLIRMPWNRHGDLLVSLGVMIPLVWLFLFRARPTFETAPLSFVFYALFLFLVGVNLVGALHLRAVARALLRMANAVDNDPLQFAFRRLPERIGRQFGSFPKAQRPGIEAFLLPARQWDALRAILGKPPYMVQLWENDRKLAAKNSGQRLKSPAALIAKARKTMNKLGQVPWATRTLAASFAPGAKPPAVDPHNVDQAREDFAAICITLYLSQFLLYVRHQMLIVTVSPILLLLAMTLYHFEPQNLFSAICNGLIILSATVTLTVLVQINHNGTFSHINQTQPFYVSLDRDFLISVIAYASPIVILVLTQFDEVSNWFFSWMQTL